MRVSRRFARVAILFLKSKRNNKYRETFYENPGKSGNSGKFKVFRSRGPVRNSKTGHRTGPPAGSSNVKAQLCEHNTMNTFLTLGGRIRCNQCQAKSKRTGQQCRLPAMTEGKAVCRTHGGLSTGPKDLMIKVHARGE